MMASKITVLMGNRVSQTFMKGFMEVEWLIHKALDVVGSVVA